MNKTIVYLTLLVGYLLPLPAMAIPTIQQSKISNGLNIMLMEAHQVPIVSMQLVFPAGSRMDQTYGSASLLAQMLTDHTAKHQRNDWLNLIDENALRLGAHVNEDGLYIQLSFLREDLDVAIQALQELLLYPGWNHKRFNTLKKQTLTGLQKAQENAGILASWEVRKRLYGSHPYGHPSSGTPETVKKLQINDLKKLYQQQVQPNGATLAISGDITLNTLKTSLQSLEKHWQGQVKITALDIQHTKPIKPFSTHITLPQQQSTIVMVRFGLAKHDPDLFPTIVLNYILGGGGFASHLMQEVREKRGLAYGVYSFFSNKAAIGSFEIHLKTRQDQAKLAKKTVRDVLAKLYRGIQKEDLKAAQANLTGSFAQRVDSNRERAANIANIGLYQLPNDYLQNWTQQINSVTLADVNKVAKRFLSPESWSLIQVGSVSGEKND